MFLTLTNSKDATADFLISHLESSGVKSVRINSDEVLSHVSIDYSLTNPVFRLDGEPIKPEKIKLLWYRRPEPLRIESPDMSPEAKYTIDEWGEALNAILAHVPKHRWVNHPSANATASLKLHQLSIALDLGMSIPDTIVTQVPEQAKEFLRKHDGTIVVKPMAIAYIERNSRSSPDSLIYTNKVEAEHVCKFEEVKNCPTMFQEYIDKEIDVRVTVVDDKFHAVGMTANENGRQRCDIRRNNMQDVTYQAVTMPEIVKVKLSNLMRRFGLRFGAVDFVVDSNGQWHFLEINPNGQWAWLDQLAGTNISNSFIRAMEKFEP